MISDFVKKESVRQTEYLKGSDICLKSIMFEHKIYLVNLKEYLKELYIAGFNYYVDKYDRSIHFYEDIKELTKIIEKYDAKQKSSEVKG